mmetsp:Transcript_28171/g.76218  ORF Transcript_28171/g.76218 Transcript_28171/m.76218 type:complete len:347 (-) Transcript_28171:31-1071(-)
MAHSRCHSVLLVESHVPPALFVVRHVLIGAPPFLDRQGNTAYDGGANERRAGPLRSRGETVEEDHRPNQHEHEERGRAHADRFGCRVCEREQPHGLTQSDVEQAVPPHLPPIVQCEEEASAGQVFSHEHRHVVDDGANPHSKAGENSCGYLCEVFLRDEQRRREEDAADDHERDATAELERPAEERRAEKRGGDAEEREQRVCANPAADCLAHETDCEREELQRLEPRQNRRGCDGDRLEGHQIEERPEYRVAQRADEQRDALGSGNDRDVRVRELLAKDRYQRAEADQARAAQHVARGKHFRVVGVHQLVDRTVGREYQDGPDQRERAELCLWSRWSRWCGLRLY